MNQRISAILVVALVISAGATYAIYRWISARTAQSGVQAVQVVQAARNLEIGVLIKDSDLRIGTWAGTPPAGIATKKETLIDRGVVAPIYEGEAINENRLAAAGAGGGLAATIPAGMRAVAVRVNEIVGVAGFAVPGMRVDILISGNAPGQNAGGPEVRTILQNIAVLSAGQNFQKDAEGKPISVQVVNLLVTPEQAEILSLASNESHNVKIQLVLRNPLDTQPAKVPGSRMASLFGAEPPRPPVAARPSRPRVMTVAAPAPGPLKIVVLPPYEVEVFNGGTRTEAKFPRPPEAKQ